MNKILICIPTLGKIDVKTAQFAGILSKQPNIEYLPIIGLPVDEARNRAVNIFLQNEQFTHLFFLDDDVIPPDDCIDKLLSLKAPITSGIYPLISPVGIQWSVGERGLDPQPNRGKYVYKLVDRLKSHTEPFEADMAGTGCLLIRRDVFDKLEWPYFKTLSFKDGSRMTEDTYFFERTFEAGIKLIIHPEIQCSHNKTIDLLLFMKNR